MALKEYKSKRNFSVTSEPNGDSKKKKNGIFVVQFHEASRDHYDLRLEYDGVLLSWAVPKAPSFNPKVKRLAVMVEDHPIDYADFEGEIPLGEYGGGMVTIYDKGKYEPKVNFADGLKEGSLKFTLFGSKLYGDWALVRMESKNWLLIKEKDEFSDDSAEVETKTLKPEKTKKLKSGERNSLMGSVINSLKKASVGADIPSGKEWLFEVKYDGYRTIALSSPSKLLSRLGTDMTDKFPSIAKAIDELVGDKEVVFDGEVAAIKDGKISFSALSEKSEVVYFIFDLLYCDGDMRSLPLSERKNKLRHILKNATTPLYYVQSYLDGQALFEAIKEMDMEGIVCKRKDASYYEDDWIKVKLRKRQEFVVCGYLGEEKISSVLLGVYDKGRLRYVGKVGSGINSGNSKKLYEAFVPLKTDVPTLKEIKTKVNWLTPSLMAEVEFAEWTESGKLRQPVFKGLRSDKKVTSVVTEIPVSYRGITITHPDKAVYDNPVITKAEIAKYYDGITDKILPFLKNRPVSVLRCNDGIKNPFFVKHPPKNKDEFIYIDSPQELMNEVQLGTVEFHVASSEGNVFFMVFDLDPDPELDLSVVRKCASDVKSTLDKLKLRSFLKVSGGKGFHIVAPMPPCQKEQFAMLSRSIAEQVASKNEIYTLNIKKDKRKGKIFIDWQRNSPSATAIAPYSLRARSGAPVSMPIAWSKLDSSLPNGYNIFSPIKSDPWKNFF